MSLYENFFAYFNGLVAGWSQVFVMQPFEIIKVRLQTQPQNAKIYNGIIDCLTKIITQEGPLALYKGTLTPLMGVGILGSARFGFYEFAQRHLSEFKKVHASQLSVVEKAGCGLFAGFFNSFLLTVIEHTRIRIQIQKSAADKIYSGSLDALIKIYQQHGVRGLWRGLGPSMVRESTGLMFLFLTSEAIYKRLSPPGVGKKDLPIWIPMVGGGIGGITYWMFNYPFDYVKTLMQSDTFGNFKYSSMWDCFRKEYAANGWRVFYKGYVICMMRSFPVNSILLVTYRVMQKVTGVESS